MLTSTVLCLALIIHNEAGGEKELGKVAVAKVVLNRAKSHKNTCKVIYEKHQFYTKPIKSKGEHWEKSKQLAKKVLSGHFKDPTNGATHFHNGTVKPKWAKMKRKTAKIGKHYFYKSLK